jgi:hypothetical protein
VFWQIFLDTNALVMGYVTTGLHVVFALTQTAVALASTRAEAPAWPRGTLVRG